MPKGRKLPLRNCRDPFALYFPYHFPGVKDSAFSLLSRAFLLANYAKFWNTSRNKIERSDSKWNIFFMYFMRSLFSSVMFAGFPKQI